MLANNILTINHLLKILGSFCAEDFQQFIDYKTLSDQHNYASPTDLHRTPHRPAPEHRPLIRGTKYLIVSQLQRKT